MDPTVLSTLLDKVANICNNVTNAGDAEKYAAGVHTFTEDVNETYAIMRDIICQDNTLTTDEKLERLKQIALLQEESKQRGGDAIHGNRENLAGTITNMFNALVATGVSLPSQIVGGITEKFPKVVLPQLDEHH
ncbi:MAG: hypothetical protein IKV74_07590 [Clostridia bacterium]|nr:hypothetical protein [Clostridia bacterium]